MATVQLSAARRALLERYIHGGIPEATRPSGILSRRPDPDSALLSFEQQQLWLLSLLVPDKPVFNECITVHLPGALAVGALERSLNEIVRRHEAWRTTFSIRGERVIQLIHPASSLTLPVVDLQHLPAAEREREAICLAAEEMCRPYDLARGPLLRAMLVRLAAEDHRLYIALHHMLFDGISAYQIFPHELHALYQVYTTGAPSPLPEQAIQQGDYAYWQRETASEAALADGLAYWTKQLAGAPTCLELPTDRPRPPIQTYRGATYPIVLPEDLADALKWLSRQQGVTLYMTLVAALSALLYRYAGQDEFLLGTAVSTREGPHVETLLGFLLNLVVLRADCSGNPTFRELLQRVREVVVGAHDHKYVPFEYVVRALLPERDMSRNPLFQVLLTLLPSQPRLPGGWTVTQMDVTSGTSKFDLSVQLAEDPEGLIGRFEYNTDLFDAATIARMCAHWRTLLEGIVADPDQRLSDLPLLTEPERQQLLGDWNATHTGYPRNKCVHQLFEDHVRGTPDRVAVVDGATSLTYTELNRRANQLAHLLRGLGVGPEVPVGLCMERSAEMVVGLLGILKAGGYYVPMDSTYPKERLAFMLQDTSAPVLIIQPELADHLPTHDAHVVCLDGSWQTIARQSAADVVSAVGPDNLAYVMYTSGSTGRPKGVAVPHRAIIRLLFGVDYVQLGSEEVLLHMAPISFDASTFELWGALLHGGRCVLMRDRVPTPSGIGEVIATQGVTTTWLTASLFNALIDEDPHVLRGVKQVLTGGEALSVAHIRRALAALPGTTFVNGYGPTESTTFACCFPIPAHLPPAVRSIPIGRPIGNTTIYILDRFGHPVPLGIAGELHIGGDGLARGYLNQPELTAEKFVSNPFSDTPSARLYKTGDFARYLPDGTVEFLGRLDQQVKIRGFRIELGEIEAAVAQHLSVRDAVVIAHEDQSGQKRLAAYVVTDGEASLTTDDFLHFLKQKLPDYMLPSTFTVLDSLPVTRNGKVDLRALPAPEVSGHAGHAPFVSPTNDVQHQLVRMWEDLLNRRPIGIRDSFFDLGGHSLLAARFVTRVEQTFGQKLPLASFFADPTIESIALSLGSGREDEWSPLMRVQVAGDKRPFFFMHGRWLAGGAYCWQIADDLGPDQPFYALQPFELNDLAHIATIESMAAQYVHLVREVQPEGPYLLGGYCNGGVVAFEMARQLTAQGERVDLLFVIDATLMHGRLLFARRCIRFLGDWLRLGTEKQLRTYIRLRFAYIQVRNGGRGMLDGIRSTGRAALARWAFRFPKRQRTGEAALTRSGSADGASMLRGERQDNQGTTDDTLEEDALKTLSIYEWVIAGYVPRPYPGRVIHVWSSAEAGDPALTWTGLAKELETYIIPGTHTTCLSEHLDDLTAHLKSCLNRAQQEAVRYST